tara:strand:- start:47 stop:649 length:603 start_codon:yes stop_codon:yes gene_type:complete
MGWLFGGRGILEDIARMLPVKTRRIVGIILLSGGIILSIFGLGMIYLFPDADKGSIVPAMGLICLMLLGLGIISMVMSIHFFRKFEDRGWLEDALFHWSFWSDLLIGDEEYRKQENNNGNQEPISKNNWIGPDGIETGSDVPEDWYLTYNGPAPIVEGIHEENYAVDRGDGAVPIDFYIKKWGVPEGFGKTDHEQLWSME